MTLKKQQKKTNFKHASGYFQSGKISLVGTITVFLPYSTNPWLFTVIIGEQDLNWVSVLWFFVLWRP